MEIYKTIILQVVLCVCVNLGLPH